MQQPRRLRAPEITFERAKALRRALTLPETILWERLRNRRLNGLRFRRQHPIGPWILDFYCPAAKLAVEVDGQHHAHGEVPARDERRDAWLVRQGVEVLRFSAADILKDEPLALILEVIARTAAERQGTGPLRHADCVGAPPPPLAPLAGEEP